MTRPRLKALVLAPGDDVAVLLDPVTARATVTLSDGRTIVARDDARRYFKIAVADIEAGQTIRKHGQSIGTATMDILRGQIVHTHNLTSGRAVI